ncbi:MAG TPA: HTTM domain-containing protein [Chitinophagaceae bacterium]
MAYFKENDQHHVNLSTGEIRDFRSHKLKALFLPVDIASVVYFRIIFGLIMLWEVSRYFSKDWIARYWIKPAFHFTYWPFDFLQPLPGIGMYIIFGVLALLSLFIVAGFLFRASVILFFFGFTYTFLLEQTRYLNHFYLVVLISFILIFIPASKAGSLDALIFPRHRSQVVPAWCLWILRFTIGLPYFFGGIAKINSDWLAGEPMRSWLLRRTDFPLIGQYFTEEWMVYSIAYGGLLLDILIVPLLLIKRTRKFAFLAALLFHLMNARLFTIGIFPWFMIAATAIYFDPSWPRKFLSKLRIFSADKQQHFQPALSVKQSSTQVRNLITAALISWCSLHIILPFRHLLISGNVHWTEEGHKYSWHMKLRSKNAKGIFIVKDKATGKRMRIKPRAYLTSWQERKMLEWPNLIWQFCQMVKQDHKRNGMDVAVYANISASLNGRPHQLLINPSVDIAAQPRPVVGHAPWIFPLQTPLEVGNPDAVDEVVE